MSRVPPKMCVRQSMPVDEQAQCRRRKESQERFHFKKEMGASRASDVFELHVSHGPDSTEHVLHTAGHDGLAPIQQADPVGLSLAEQTPLITQKAPSTI